MKRIEDIKPRVKRKIVTPEASKPFLSQENFLAESDSLPVVETELPKPNFRKQKIKVRSWWLAFFLLLICIIFFAGFELLKAKAQISGNISNLSSNFSQLSNAMSKKDFATINSQIQNLNQKSTNSIIILQSVGQDVYALNLLYPKGKSSKITAEIDLLRGSQMLLESFSKVFNFDSLSFSKSQNTDYLSKINNYLSAISQILSAAPNKIRQASLYSGEAQNLSQSANSDWFSSSDKNSVRRLQDLSKTSADFFNYLQNVPESLSSTLTLNGGKKSYLILFLNNTEIRPGGGFIGSFARLDLNNGRATALDFETNIYTLDKTFVAAGNKIAPEEDISSITNDWTMRDANIYADYATSSQKVAWFYQQESGKKVDGVIALDTTLFQELLKVTGPIDMPDYNLEISDENFLSDVQYQVEIGYYQDKSNWSENQPKKILSDMMPKFLSALTASVAVESAAGKEIIKGISEKHLLAFSENSTVEDLLDGIGMSGKIHDANGDYLYISESNLGVNKSSLNVVQTVDQNVEIDSNGKISEKLSIVRKHSGSYEWPDGENKSLMRIFIPLSSQIDSSVQKTQSQFGKNSVVFWQNTLPGQSSNSTVDYHRDSAINITNDSFDYQITIQKQSGIESYKWNLYLVYPQGWKPQNVEGYDATNRKIYLSNQISKDSVFRLHFIRD